MLFLRFLYQETTGRKVVRGGAATLVLIEDRGDNRCAEGLACGDATHGGRDNHYTVDLACGGSTQDEGVEGCARGGWIRMMCGGCSS